MVSLKQIWQQACELSKIKFRNEYPLECFRTAFSWSALPNTLCLAADKNHITRASDNPNIVAVIIPKALENLIPDINKKIWIATNTAPDLFYFLHNTEIHKYFNQDQTNNNIHKSATIASDVYLGKNISIGENVEISHGCVILDNTIIEDGSIIYENVTLGTEGFFSKAIFGKKTHIQHFGGVLIGKNCILHAGCNVSRSVNYGEYTSIGQDTHVGIQTNIAHDVHIGERCNLSAKVCLAGRANVGNDVWIGASCSISNAIKIADNVDIKIGSVVVKNIKINEVVSGNFAYSHKKRIRKFIELLHN